MTDESRLVARSASDKTDDWPFWMVWDGTRNVTGSAVELATGGEVPRSPFGPGFLPRGTAEAVVAHLRGGGERSLEGLARTMIGDGRGEMIVSS